MKVEQIIDQKLYPIQKQKSQQIDSVCNKANKNFQDNGFAILPNFLTDSALEQARLDALNLISESQSKEQFLKAVVDDSHSGSSRSFEYQCKLGYLAGDQLEDNEILQTLHSSDWFLKLIEDTLNRGPLYRLEDKLASMSIAILAKDDYIDWHLDQSKFVVYMILSDCESGGTHQIIEVRKPDGSYDSKTIDNAINGVTLEVDTIPLVQGSLVIFDGKRLLHKITPVQGKAPKMVSIFFFSFKQGVKSSEDLRQARFGRIN